MQWDITDTVISIHALLAESDLFDEDDPDNLWSISIHALLAESDWQAAKALDRLRISIHALLAESDPRRQQPRQTQRYFYPRSPCGERPPVREIIQWEGIFLSTLSLRRATSVDASTQTAKAHISIHALLAESDNPMNCLSWTNQPLFLSTLSLRRATLPARRRS